PSPPSGLPWKPFPSSISLKNTLATSFQIRQTQIQSRKHLDKETIAVIYFQRVGHEGITHVVR
ncbi:MAG: hypothetical protein R6V12_06530, partial [Candidatus Hydrogenedentota bacterium]